VGKINKHAQLPTLTNY